MFMPESELQRKVFS